MSHYYSQKLSSDRLKRCYDIAPLRVQKYLTAEIDFVLSHVEKSDCVLELGCGYGRVLEKLIPKSFKIIGIDVSQDSLTLAKEYTALNPKLHLIQANAKCLPFPKEVFDKVICIQNGISAFKINPQILIQESVRITRPSGKCIFSSYSDKFWESRLQWFEMQSNEGLLGKIDWEKTKNGVIVCDDGFTATTFNQTDFEELSTNLDLDMELIEVDNSSVFCIISV